MNVFSQRVSWIILAVLISMLWGSAPMAAEECAATWYSLGYAASDNHAWFDVAAGPNRLVAVGDIGYTSYSNDGKKWYAGSLIRNYHNSVIYAFGKYVAVGWHGSFAYSSDGASWSQYNKDLLWDFKSLVYNPDKSVILAVGQGGWTATSTNGVSWNLWKNDGDFKHMLAVTYGNGKYIAACGDGYIRSSTDGKNWTDVQVTSQHLYGAAYGNGVYVVVGAGGVLFSSNDGITWKARTSNAQNNNLWGVIYTGSVFVAVGDNVRSQKSSPTLVSSNGSDWLAKDSKMVVSLLGLDYSPELKVISARGVWDSAIYSYCDGGSSIDPNITFTTPKGGERWTVGKVYNVTWTSYGAGGYLKMEYSIDDGKTWIVFDNSGGNDGVREWDIPDVHSDTCRVRLSSISTPSLKAISERFSIWNPNNVTITSPNGSESWQAGMTKNIKWKTQGTVGKVRLEYSLNGALNFTPLIVSTDNDGAYEWKLPSNLESTNCYIRIMEVGKIHINDMSDKSFSIFAPPQIHLDRSRLNFGYVISGAYTSGQKLEITNTGGGTLEWSLTSDVDWLTFTPASGSGDALTDISLNTANLLTPGVFTATVTVSSPNAVKTSETFTVFLTVKKLAEEKPPFGEFGSPLAGTTAAGSVPVTGWVLDDIEITSVKIYYNEKSYIGEALFVEGARPDVAAAYPDYPNNTRAGWGYMMLSNSLPDGNYRIYAVAIDKNMNEKELGGVDIIIDNAHAVKPFGTIDTPAPGGEISGIRFVNWGWALTPKPNMIPKDGKTIKVYIDGVSLGNPYEYNVNNPNVKNQFSDYLNSDGPTGYKHIDTTQYANGLHNISWTVKDNAGNEDGVGSRYFIIRNLNSSRGHMENTASGKPAAAETAKLTGRQGSLRKVSQLANIPAACAPVKFSSDYSKSFQTAAVSDNENADAVIAVRENQRIRIDLNDQNDIPRFYTGYMAFGEELHPLPAGSTLDSGKGLFYWQLGAGFMGQINLVFIGEGSQGEKIRRNITVSISPKFSLFTPNR